MSISVCGMADHQRLMFERSDSAAVTEVYNLFSFFFKNKKKFSNIFLINCINSNFRSYVILFFKEEWLEEWRLRVCKNSLEAVHAKFCGESSSIILNKKYQDSFVKENIETIRDNFQVFIFLLN